CSSCNAASARCNVDFARPVRSASACSDHTGLSFMARNTRNARCTDLTTTLLPPDMVQISPDLECEIVSIFRCVESSPKIVEHEWGASYTEKDIHEPHPEA